MNAALAVSIFCFIFAVISDRLVVLLCISVPHRYCGKQENCGIFCEPAALEYLTHGGTAVPSVRPHQCGNISAMVC